MRDAVPAVSKSVSGPGVGGSGRMHPLSASGSSVLIVKPRQIAYILYCLSLLQASSSPSRHYPQHAADGAS